jgi:hypothetical protein
VVVQGAHLGLLLQGLVRGGHAGHEALQAVENCGTHAGRSAVAAAAAAAVAAAAGSSGGGSTSSSGSSAGDSTSRMNDIVARAKGGNLNFWVWTRWTVCWQRWLGRVCSVVALESQLAVRTERKHYN